MQNVLLISNNIVREGYCIISPFHHTLIQLFLLHSSEKNLQKENISPGICLFMGML